LSRRRAAVQRRLLGSVDAFKVYSSEYMGR